MVRALLSPDDTQVNLTWMFIKPLAAFLCPHPTTAPCSLATSSSRSTTCSESPPLSIPVNDDEVQSVHEAQSVQASAAMEEETDEEELGAYFLVRH
jgi:hypothetical protein